jgi:hypothetical protein
MDDKRDIDSSKIPDKGILIGRIDRFALVIHKDGTYHLIDESGGDIVHLTHLDLEEIRTLLELSNDWHAAHRLITK